MNLVITSCANNDGTSRSGDLCTLLGTNLAGITAIRQGSNGGRTGSGGTLNTNNTGIGYYSLSTSGQNIVSITSTTGGYTGDYAIVAIRSNGTQGANSDKGTVVYLDFTIYSDTRTDGTPGGPGGATGGYFNDSVNITLNHRIDIVYPESTNLTNSWGTVTIS